MFLWCSESSNACEGLEQGGQAGESWWEQSGLAGGNMKGGGFLQEPKEILPEMVGKEKIDREKLETVTGLIFLGSKITADGDCSHEIKRCLLLERKAMTNLDSILKSRDITLPTKVYIVKAMVFPVVMYGCESWTIKKAEH